MKFTEAFSITLFSVFPRMTNALIFAQFNGVSFSIQPLTSQQTFFAFAKPAKFPTGVFIEATKRLVYITFCACFHGLENTLGVREMQYRPL